MSDRYLNISQLCQRFNLNRRTVYNWVAKDEIPHLRAGRVLRFSAEEVEAWMKSHRDVEDGVDRESDLRSSVA